LAEDIDGELISQIAQTADGYLNNMDSYHLQTATSEIWRLLDRANKYIDGTTPWILGKDDGAKPRLAAVLYTLAEVLRVSSVMLAPLLPGTAEKIRDMLGLRGITDFSAELAYSGDTSYTITKGENLFPRVL
jgi:methionyl-tRNA synthetase